MNEIKHTPLPWKTEGRHILSSKENFPDFIAICGRLDTEPHSEENKANAELIIRAVNSHDALVEALRIAEMGLRGEYPHYTHKIPSAKSAREAALYKVQEALNLAKGD